MKEVNAIIKNCKNPVKCPICNNNMVYIIKGELFGNKWSKLNDEGLQYGKDYINLGILFGDDRDSVWICKQCKKNYDADL